MQTLTCWNFDRRKIWKTWIHISYDSVFHCPWFYTDDFFFFIFQCLETYWALIITYIELSFQRGLLNFFDRQWLGDEKLLNMQSCYIHFETDSNNIISLSVGTQSRKRRRRFRCHLQKYQSRNVKVPGMSFRIRNPF